MSGTGRRPLINPMIAGVIAGVVIALVVGIMAKINLDFAAPWAHTHTVSALVTDADGISASSDVRIAGRLVGQVTNVTSKGDHSEVLFHVEDTDWPLPADTTASIRLATLLGQKYVELTPGRSSTMLADNAIIGLNRTTPVVDFDQILDTFDKPTRTSLVNIVKTLAGGLQNQEGTIQNLLPDLRDLSQHSVVPTGELVNRDAELNNILTNLGVTADQLSKSRDDLAGVIDNLNSVTGALASHQGALRGYIRNVDAVNQTTDAVLGNGGGQQFAAGLQRLNGVAHQGQTLFHDLLPQAQSFSVVDPHFGASPLDATINLIYEIGDATSQTNQSGYFLRQFVDTGKLDLFGVTNNPTPGQQPQSAVNGGGPVLPTPVLPVPPPPVHLPVPPPSLPPAPSLPAPSLPGPTPPGVLPSPSIPGLGIFQVDPSTWWGNSVLTSFWTDAGGAA